MNWVKHSTRSPSTLPRRSIPSVFSIFSIMSATTA
ncbi:Uncharacterised protein [Mycobacterium tuberculosis]|nr:Uncharacterised protein [Mycobacterium tuberculosis]